MTRLLVAFLFWLSLLCRSYAAVAFIADGGYASGNASGGNASVTLTFPAGIAAGNLVLAAIAIQYFTSGSGAAATPTGWTLVTSTTENNSGSFMGKLFLYAAIWSSGLTGTFTGSGLGAGGIDGDIKGYSGAGSTVGTALGNSSAVTSGGSNTIALIPGPSGFTTGQWNYWAAINPTNQAISSTSPALAHVYYNSGNWEAFEVGDTTPGSAPGTETVTWGGSAIVAQGVGVTILVSTGVTKSLLQLGVGR